MKEEVDVVVVGGGLSGLMAARELLKANKTVILFEAKDHVGGRTESSKSPFDSLAELGAGYVGKSEKRVIKLIEEFKLTLMPVYFEGKDVFISTNKKRWEIDCTKQSAHSAQNSQELQALIDETENLAKELFGNDKFFLSNPISNFNTLWNYFDNINCQQWIEMKTNDEVTRVAYISMVKTLTATEAKDVSFLYWVWLVNNANGSIGEMNDTVGGAQEFTLLEGTSSLSTHLLRELQKNSNHFSIYLNNAVTKISSLSPTSIEVFTRSNLKVKTKRVIVTIPPTLYQRIHFEPALVPQRYQLAAKMPMSCMIKTITFYRDPFWRRLGYSGRSYTHHDPFSLIKEEEMEEKVTYKYPITETYDNVYQKTYSIVGFIHGDCAKRWSFFSPEERKNAIVKQYRDIFNTDEALDAIGYVDKNWAEEEFSGGCFMAIPPPGCFAPLGPLLWTPERNIYWAGTESSKEWTGYMEGALEAGERVARDVVLSLSQVAKL